MNFRKELEEERKDLLNKLEVITKSMGISFSRQKNFRWLKSNLHKTHFSHPLFNEADKIINRLSIVCNDTMIMEIDG